MSDAHRSWMINAVLIGVALLSISVLHIFQRPAAAAGGGWDTDGVMVNTTENDTDRLVLVDTRRKRIMVYRNEGIGVFRLVAARSYRYDTELKDTSGIIDIERKNGATFMQVYDISEGRNRTE